MIDSKKYIMPEQEKDRYRFFSILDMPDISSKMRSEINENIREVQ